MDNGVRAGERGMQRLTTASKQERVMKNESPLLVLRAERKRWRNEEEEEEEEGQVVAEMERGE